MKKFIFAVIIVLLLMGFLKVFNMVFPTKYDDLVTKNAEEYGVQRELIFAIIKAESNFDAEATSSKGAKGLMQITPETAAWCAEKMGMKEFEEKDLKTPEVNIKIGTWYFSYLDTYFENDNLALASYNGGISNIKKWLKDEVVSKERFDAEDIPFPETRQYVKKVNSYRGIYKTILELKKMARQALSFIIYKEG